MCLYCNTAILVLRDIRLVTINKLIQASSNWDEISLIFSAFLGKPPTNWKSLVNKCEQMLTIFVQHKKSIHNCKQVSTNINNCQ